MGVSRSLAVALAASSGLFSSAAYTQPLELVAASEIVVTAAGYEQKIAEAPASISVISREQLETRPFNTLGDAVRHVEGVTVAGSDTNATDIIIRGMPGEYTLIMLDGRRQTTRETMNRGTGGVQASLIPPLAAIERIEVVRGPMSSLYGSDAMGGVINIITRKVPDHLQASASVGGIAQEDGDYGNSTFANFWAGAPLASDRVGLQLFGGFHHRGEDDLYFPRSITTGTNRIRDRNLSGKLAFVLAPGHELTVDAGYNFLSYTETPGRSGGATAALVEEKHKRNYQALSYAGALGFADVKLAYHREQEKFRTFSNRVKQSDPDLVNNTVDALVTAPLADWNTLSLGAQYVHSRVRSIANQDNVAGYVNVDKITREAWAVFAEDRLEPMDGLIVTGGLRLDHYDSFGTHLTPRLYVNYTPVERLTLRGGVARGFKAPTLRQSVAGYCMATGGGVLVRGPLCGNPDLDPETSTTKEIGLYYDGEGKLNFGLTLFHNNFKNKVVSYQSADPDPVNPSRPLYVYDNIDRVVIKGVEINATVPLNSAFVVSGNYTLTDSKRKGGGEPAFDGSSLDGRPLDKTPRHMANLRADLEVDDQLSLYALAAYMGKQYYSGFRNGAMKTRTRAASTTYDLGAVFRINDHLSLKAAVLNLTDKKVPVDERGRFEGLDGNWMLDEGRRFWGTATFSF